MSHSKLCLNCDNPATAKFCDNCGQKTDTHRITFKHFIFHDILHGIWHFEKGILFTIKEAFTRPGQAALDYISGKRIRYYNVFYLILLIIGLNIFLTHYYDEIYNSLQKTILESSSNKVGKDAEEFLGKYAKILIFSFVPFFALNSYLIFKRAKLNLSEHTIIAGITFVSILVLTTLGNILFFFDFTTNFQFISHFANITIPILIFFYIIFSYYTAFKKKYSYFGFYFRMLFFFILSIIELATFLILLYGFVTHWKFSVMKI